MNPGPSYKSSNEEDPDPEAALRLVERRKGWALVLTSIGITLEWYDFFVYGTIAALVFPQYFFPPGAGVIATLVSLVSYWVGFVARAVGAMVIGSIADRFGRKLALFIDLVIMGIATLGIALTPGYESIGYWGIAIVSIFRFVQGLALGGEWGAASAFITEFFHRSRYRSFWGSWVQIGVPIGLLIGTWLTAYLISIYGEQAFAREGWRIPFYIGAAVAVIAGIIRYAVLESPLFREILRRGEVSKAPVREVFRGYWNLMVCLMLGKAGQNALFYIYAVYSLIYLTGIGVPKAFAALIVTIAALLEVIAEPIGGLLGDLIGRRKTILIANIAIAAYAIPFPLLLIALRHDILLASLALGVYGVLHGIAFAPQTAYFSELFPTRVRSTAIGTAFQLTTVFAGGLSPILITLIVGNAYIENWWGVSAITAGYALISIAALATLLPETLGKPLPR